MKSKLITLMMALALFTGVKAQSVWFDANFGEKEWWDALHTASLDPANTENPANATTPPNEIRMDTLQAGNALNFASGNTFVLENVVLPYGTFRINANGFRDAAFTSVCGETFEYSIRLRNSTGTNPPESFIEFPEVANVSKVTVYAQNQNATTESHLSLQKKNSDGGWDNVGDAITIPGTNNLTPTGALDFEAVYDNININEPVTLRIWKAEQRFMKIFRIVVEKFDDGTSVQSPVSEKPDLFVTGKTLNFSGNVNNADLSVFNLAGIKVFNCKVNSNKVDLQDINAGAYIVKLITKEGEAVKKVIIK